MDIIDVQKLSELVPCVEKKRMEYFWEVNRLESFKKWPFKDTTKCSKQKVAEAGFFSVATENEPDAVQCFICNKQLDGWESTDDPWQEHTKHSRNCLFVKLGKSEENITLYEMFDLINEMTVNLINTYYDKKEKVMKKVYEAKCKTLTAYVRKFK